MKTIAKPNQTVAPTFEPVDLSEVKRQVSLAEGANQWNEFLRDAITQAREQFEYDTGIVACTSTWAEKLDQWPEEGYIVLHRRPVASISSITYLDTAGSSQTWASSNYTLDANRAEPTIFLTYDGTFPALRTIENAVTITYVAGYAAGAIPQMVKHAVLLQVAHAFMQREPFVVGASASGANGTMNAYEAIVNRLTRASYP